MTNHVTRTLPNTHATHAAITNVFLLVSGSEVSYSTRMTRRENVDAPEAHVKYRFK